MECHHNRLAATQREPQHDAECPSMRGVDSRPRPKTAQNSGLICLRSISLGLRQTSSSRALAILGGVGEAYPLSHFFSCSMRLLKSISLIKMHSYIYLNVITRIWQVSSAPDPQSRCLVS